MVNRYLVSMQPTQVLAVENSDVKSKIVGGINQEQFLLSLTHEFGNRGVNCCATVPYAQCFYGRDSEWQL